MTGCLVVIIKMLIFVLLIGYEGGKHGKVKGGI